MFNTSKIFTSFSVTDLSETLDFYSKTLKLDVSKNEMGLLSIQLITGSRIIIYEKADHIPATFTILNFPVDNIEKAVDDLIEIGVVFEQYGEPMKTDIKGICKNDFGPTIAWFKDPSGNILALIQE